MEGGVVDEFGGFGVAVIVVWVVVWVPVWVFGRLEFWGWHVDGEGGKGVAVIGQVGDCVGVGGEGYRCVEACSGCL